MLASSLEGILSLFTLLADIKLMTLTDLTEDIQHTPIRQATQISGAQDQMAELFEPVEQS